MYEIKIAWLEARDCVAKGKIAGGWEVETAGLRLPGRDCVAYVYTTETKKNYENVRFSSSLIYFNLGTR